MFSYDLGFLQYWYKYVAKVQLYTSASMYYCCIGDNASIGNISYLTITGDTFYSLCVHHHKVYYKDKSILTFSL
jgi:hypothetical protein